MVSKMNKEGCDVYHQTKRESVSQLTILLFDIIFMIEQHPSDRLRIFRNNMIEFPYK